MAESCLEMEQHKTLDCGHGRIEKRTYYLSTEVGWYQNLAQWTGIQGFGMVQSEVEQNGQIVGKPDISLLLYPACLHLQTQSENIGRLKTPFTGVWT